MPHSSSFYRTILDNTDTGYAYQRLITNEDGYPVDYEFIDVNPAFEKLTGWKRSDIKGQLISRLVPNFREIYADLLSRCGNVALRGQKENCEVYFYGLQKWFRIAAYSPEPGFIVAILSDISEFKKVEEELRESEARWKYALEGSGDGVWDWNVKDNIVFYSRQWKNILGFAEDEISNSLAEWEYRVHPDDRQQALDAINRCLSGETKMYYNEHRLCCKDGTYKWILDRGMVIKYDAEGKPSHMMGTLTDINRRKRLEQSLLGQEANLRSFFNTVDSSLFVIDLEGNIIEVNATALQVLGYRSGELRGQNIRIIHPEDFNEDGCKFFKSALISGSNTITMMMRSKDRKKLIPTEARIKKGFWNGEEVFFVICRDISELQLSEQKFSRAFNINASMMTITTLDEGKYIDINESCLRTMEFEREEVIGRTTEELGIYADAKQRDVILNLLLAEGSIRDIEVNFRSKNGKIIIGLMSADILRIDTKDYLLTMVTDITERRLMEKELEEKNQRLQELNQKLKMQTITDDLTGIYNHRYIFQCLQQELRRAKRYEHPLTVMMLDLDHFKLVNDRWGHQVGDHVLKSVARIIASNLRETDMVGRYGGEEFLVILPMTDIKDGLQVAERIRKEVQEASFSQKGLKVTISIGAAQYNGDKLDKLIGGADSLLYQAKNNGRNRVEY